MALTQQQLMQGCRMAEVCSLSTLSPLLGFVCTALQNLLALMYDLLQGYTEESLAFMEKVLEKSGLGPTTYLPDGEFSRS